LPQASTFAHRDPDFPEGIMKNAPLILITPNVEPKGREFADPSFSLSDRYARSIVRAGGIPWIMSRETDPGLIAESVRRADGVLLTGGEDINPALYRKSTPAKLASKLGTIDPPRDFVEVTVIDEVFRLRKPLLAICRGHQLLNVALGGTLLIDIPTQRPEALNHNRCDLKDTLAHEVRLESDSLLAPIWSASAGGKGRGKTQKNAVFRVNTAHHQAVDKVAAPLRVTGVCPDDGIVEVMELKEPLLPYLLSIQCHPERLVDRSPGFLELFRTFTLSCLIRGQ
jgi:putative glutamine amidotransferase